MITVNQSKLDNIFKDYKDSFNLYIDQELFKWRALKRFQEKWDIDAEDFTGMIDSAFSLTDQLLSSMNNFPKGMILEFCKKDEKAVRQMFRNLFDESKDIYQRIEQFVAESDRLLALIENAKNHFQNLNSISTYLWLRYPDKYYIYKYTEFKRACELLECDFVPTKGVSKKNTFLFFEFMNQLRDYISQDTEYVEDVRKALTADCYKEDALHTATIDFVFFMNAYYEGNYDGVRYWMFSPGEKASKWEDCIKDGAMYLGWDRLGRLDQYKSRKEIQKKLQEVENETGSFKNDTLATWDFVHTLKPDDIVYVKKGRKTIIGKGIITSDFYYDESRPTYSNARKVNWTHIGNWECKEQHAQKTLTEITENKAFLAQLNTLFNDENITEVSDIKQRPTENGNEKKQYWWLTANPKVWSAGAGWNVGEKQSYTLYNQKGNKRRVFQNFLDAREGDQIICYESNPNKQIVGLAKVSRSNDGKTIEFVKTRTLKEPIDYVEFKDQPELENMEFLVNPNGSFFKLTADEYEVLTTLIDEKNEEELVHEDKNTYTEKDFLDEVFISKDELHRLKALLDHKKNIILQGAPGVGKTFCAKRLAYEIMGQKDESRIQYVQFHQNYTYEDFVMGYKPTSMGFSLENGIFYNFCLEAGNHPEKDYFFIIDEINRGNLSKIFGELLMLLEKSYRRKKITLAYSGNPFTVPDNIYIIGMMNTADRSLAMIDYALRRRFSFFKMKPGFDSIGFKKKNEQIANPKFEKIITVIKELNQAISSDDSLGEGFEIGHSYFCTEETPITDEKLNIIVEYDIIPTLEEYWFDNKDEVSKWADRLREALHD